MMKILTDYKKYDFFYFSILDLTGNNMCMHVDTQYTNNAWLNGHFLDY